MQYLFVLTHLARVILSIAKCHNTRMILVSAKKRRKNLIRKQERLYNVAYRKQSGINSLTFTQIIFSHQWIDWRWRELISFPVLVTVCCTQI